MKKKNYIEPYVLIKVVNIDAILQEVSGGNVPVDNNDEGWDDGGFNSKQNLTINNVWED